MVTSNSGVSLPHPHTKQTRFTFKIITLGSFFQEMPDGVTILNRPCIRLEESRKKWGNEYLLFNKSDAENFGYVDGGNETFSMPRETCFVGTFGVDRKKRKQIRLLRDLGIPVHKPDYFILTLDHTGDKVDKEYDVVRADPASYSQVFSCAFHNDPEKSEDYMCQTMFILQNGDTVTLNGAKYIFSGKTQTLEKM